MTYLAAGAAAVEGGALIYEGIMGNKAAKAAAAQANARGAFSDYQDRLAGLQKMNQANQVMDQAKQQTTMIKEKSLALRGEVVAAQGASGAVSTVGGAVHSQEVVEKGAAADVAATLGSAINKNTSLVEAGMNDNVDASNAITNGAAQAASLESAGQTQEIGSILSGIGTGATGVAKSGAFTSTPSTPSDGLGGQFGGINPSTSTSTQGPIGE